jgi:hypothetical protein
MIFLGTVCIKKVNYSYAFANILLALYLFLELSNFLEARLPSLFKQFSDLRKYLGGSTFTPSEVVINVLIPKSIPISSPE